MPNPLSLEDLERLRLLRDKLPAAKPPCGRCAKRPGYLRHAAHCTKEKK